ncbi:hypothetical protein PCC7424_0385 [Gloeothece citriformis PCC 7424]|uniref:Uncharacterized protein n=1 Tax=Gloeothece citriformis (strain PCC 7424) TaxID=65393 RepID=B7KC29_GLOC7|nr:hypothetical protein PCC7424_0385 [Gloeothece citriformis PCC 7424]
MRRGRILQFEREDCVAQINRIGITLYQKSQPFKMEFVEKLINTLLR